MGAAPALAQEDDEPAMVEALVVNARTPGPAWWSVSKDEAKVWVLGTGPSLPEGATWESATFDRRVKATGRVIYADVKAKGGVSKGAVTADRPWLSELSNTERARLSEISAVTGRSPEAYEKFRPTFAGLVINGDLAAKADRTKPRRSQSLLERAKSLGVRPVPVKGRIGQAIKASFEKGEHDDLSCLRWSLKPHDPAAVQQSNAEAWMRGDVRALTAKRTYDPCVQAMKAMQTSLETHEGALADAIAERLDRGESAVALVGLTPLLREGGVLDQLRQRGYRVRTPAQLDDG
jgi:uncharacterized protein YbaP (TraB family)